MPPPWCPRAGAVVKGVEVLGVLGVEGCHGAAQVLALGDLGGVAIVGYA